MKNNGKTYIIIEKRDGYMSITAEGHNEDKLVCASISAIMQTCELGLTALANSCDTVKLKSEIL